MVAMMLMMVDDECERRAQSCRDWIAVRGCTV